ncbi:MAG: DUF4386 domain-containing protein [bacterium]
MPDPHPPETIRPWPLVAGVGYLIIIATGIFAEFFVRGGILARGDAAGTASRLLASESLYRFGIAAELVMLVSDVLVAVALYVLFRGVSRNLALLAAAFRVTHAAVVAVNLIQLSVPLRMLRDASLVNALDATQREALSLLALDTHAYGYVVGLVFFGAQCLVMGRLVWSSGFAPRALGVLLGLAGVGYLVDSFARTLLASYHSHEALFGAVVIGPAVLGEVAFCVWLLVRGAALATRAPAAARPA